MKFNMFKSSVCLLFMTSILIGCQLSPVTIFPEEGLGKVNPNEQFFNVDDFSTNLAVGLGINLTGYAYVINQDGQMAASGTFGNWTQGVDGTSLADLTTPIYLASVNKTITAVAMLKAMNEFGDGAAAMMNQEIGPYLPGIWDVSQNVANLKFRDLLTHRSGFPANAGTSYNAIAGNWVSSGQPLSNSPYQYSNLNYSLVKYLIARMANLSFGLSPSANEDNVNEFFDEYVQTRIFQPVGIRTANTVGSPARYYRQGSGLGIAGWNIGDRTDFLGRGGYYMSALDVARFLAFLNHTEDILDDNSRAVMYLFAAGWSDGADRIANPLQGDRGIYFSKGGTLCNSVLNNNCNGQGVATRIVTFPNDVEVVILTNNRGGNAEGLLGIAVNAYQNAWN